MLYPQNSIILLHTQKTSIVRVCVWFTILTMAAILFVAG